MTQGFLFKLHLGLKLLAGSQFVCCRRFSYRRAGIIGGETELPSGRTRVEKTAAQLRSGLQVVSAWRQIRNPKLSILICACSPRLLPDFAPIVDVNCKGYHMHAFNRLIPSPVTFPRITASGMSLRTIAPISGPIVTAVGLDPLRAASLYKKILASARLHWSALAKDR